MIRGGGARRVIREGIQLAPLTTIRLGGAARYFARCRTVAAVKEALALAQRRGWPVHVLGGGSNTVFSDGGFAGLVLQVALRGVELSRMGLHVHVRAQAGEPWDPLVRRCVAQRLAGLECLSGIPGLVGAAPLQNVGAYGQQVADTIVRVRALDRMTLREIAFTASECGFAYRHSRFKGADHGRYVILDVTFRLQPEGAPLLRYQPLVAMLSSSRGRRSDHPDLADVRRAVLTLRRRKSMIVRAEDLHSRSCGSFFINPVLAHSAWHSLVRRYRARGGVDDVPAFPAGRDVKVPAAWLVEHAGFTRGQRRGSVGISPNHALALVNYGGTTRELLALARAVERAVEKRFGVRLVREPVVVGE